MILELKSLSYSLEATIPNNRNNGVQLSNCYTHAKSERVRLVIFRDIHYFINVIYWRVQKTSKTPNLHFQKILIAPN